LRERLSAVELEELIEQAEPCCVLDDELRIVFVNRGFEALTGRSREELRGRTLQDVFPAVSERDTPVCDEVRRAQHERTAAALEARFGPLDLWADLRLQPLAGGGLALFVSSANRRKQAEAAREHARELLAGILERVPVMITIYDPQLRRFHLNAELRRVLGWTDEDARDRGLLELCYPEPAVREEARRFMESAQPGWRELTVTAKDGTCVETAWANVRLSDETQVGIGIDLRERKRAEAAHREGERRKDDFLALLSHELRNPLAPIRNSLYILERVPPGSEQARRAVEVIDRQARQLERLVGDLLDVSRIARGKLHLERAPLELGALVERTVEDHRSLFEAAGVTLSLERGGTPLVIEGDAARVAQALGNLLGNAVKFTSRGGRVTVSLDAAGREAVLRVRDTGVGIPPDRLVGLFEPFAQAGRPAETRKGGLGLGLALVKAVAELHGGSASASSEGAGRGAELTLRLPLHSAPRAG